MKRIWIWISVLIVLLGVLVFYNFEVSRRKKTIIEDQIHKLADIRLKSIISESKEKEWTVSDTQILASVKGVYPDISSVRLLISWPPQVGDKMVLAKLECDKYSEAVSDFDSGEAPVDYVPPIISRDEFFRKLRNPNVQFGGFCADSSCEVIDRDCILRQW